MPKFIYREKPPSSADVIYIYEIKREKNAKSLLRLNTNSWLETP